MSPRAEEKRPGIISRLAPDGIRIVLLIVALAVVLGAWARSYYVRDSYSRILPRVLVWPGGVEMRLRHASTKPSDWYRAGLRPGIRTGFEHLYSNRGGIGWSAYTRERRYASPEEYEFSKQKPPLDDGTGVPARYETTPEPRAPPDFSNPQATGFAFAGFMYQRWHGAGPVSVTDSLDVVIPYWPLAATFCVLLMRPARRLLRSCRVPRPGICPACGYDLRATPHRCPECGTVPTMPSP